MLKIVCNSKFVTPDGSAGLLSIYSSAVEFFASPYYVLYTSSSHFAWYHSLRERVDPLQAYPLTTAR